MDYFRKTKFRESSLVIVLLVIGVIYFTSRDTPAKEEIDMQALIDAAVEEALANYTEESETTTTSSTTTTLVEEEFELDPPKVLINNCPASDINDAVYELLWDIEAGSGDVTSITILVEKDEDIIADVYFTKENISSFDGGLITFPTAYSKGSYSYQINNTYDTESSAYIIEISIVTEQPNGDLVFAYDLCFANYSPPTTTTIVAPNLDYENGCSSLLDKYNDKSISLDAIESPFPGEIISKIYTVKGCSSSFEGTIYWELIDIFGNSVERNFTNGGAYEMGLFEFEIDTTVFEDGKYFLRVYEIDESDGESSLKRSETLLQIYISNS